MEQTGYEVKRGKHISFKGKNQQHFIRLRSLGESYSEQAIREVISGDHELGTEPGQARSESKFNLLVDIQDRMTDTRSPAYRRWATVYNLKQMSSTFLFLRENKIESFKELNDRTEDSVAKTTKVL